LNGAKSDELVAGTLRRANDPDPGAGSDPSRLTPDGDAPWALILDDEDAFADSLEALIACEGFQARKARSLAEARAILSSATPDIALVDLQLPDGDGLSLRREGLPEPLPLVVVTGKASVESAVSALRLGATDYLTKPIDPDLLRRLLRSVQRTRSLLTRVHRLREELRRAGRFGGLVGRSTAMQRLYDLVARVAPTDACVLISGESGTGKEVVARTIHEMSNRHERPLLAVNCGSIADTLVESELFGHRRGSFTGAHESRRGVFEAANGGTLFLDEIAEMPTEMQVRLLRVLETGEVRRVGSPEPVAVDVRVLAATNQIPEEAVRAGRLREDLYYRLAVFPLRVPPLRERGDDVLLLADHFLAKENERRDVPRRWSGMALEILRRRRWPGNVRELRNLVHRATILADGEILPEHLVGEQEGDAMPATLRTADGFVHVPVGTSWAEVQQALIVATLQHCDGNKQRAADLLGMSVRTLYNRLRSYSLADGEEGDA